jgi:hypothetical protein
MWAALFGYLFGYLVALVTLIQFHDGAFSAVACFVAGTGSAIYFHHRSARRRSAQARYPVRVD